MIRPMNLLDHIKDRGGTGTATCTVIAEIALAAGCAPSTLYMVALGHKQPSWKLASDIEGATAGAVTRQDLRPDVFGTAAA